MESTSKRCAPPDSRTRFIAVAVRTGSVLFSTTIRSCVAHSRISCAVFSQYCRSAARPAPWPKVLVGVLTATNTTSASAIAAGMSVEKKRFLPSVSATTSLSPGS